MKSEHQLMSLPRSTSYRNTRRILPSSSTGVHHHHHSRSSSAIGELSSPTTTKHPLPNLRSGGATGWESPSSALSFPRPGSKLRSSAEAAAGLSSLLRSLLSAVSAPAYRWLGVPSPASAGHQQQLTLAPPSVGRKITGTLFGHRRGHVTFAVQTNPRSEPALLLELATSTAALVKEMASGLVRIALECERAAAGSAARGGRRSRAPKLFQEPVWTMYCNGRKCGYALSRECGESDWRVLSTVRSVSVGAGVIPAEDASAGNDGGCGGGGGGEGELLYMRARFERVVGSRDSEAFYMMNPDGNGGPELSIFLLRV